MKKASLSFIVLLIIVAQSLAAPPFSGEKNKAIILRLEGWKTKTVEIQILDEKGKTLHMEELQIDNTSKQYDFKRLADGQYSIITSNEYKVRTQIFNVNKNGLEFVSEHYDYKPMLSYKDGYWDVNFLSSNGKATVSIYNASGREVFNRQYHERSVNRRINTENLPEGLYTIYVSNGIVSSSQQINK